MWGAPAPSLLPPPPLIPHTTKSVRSARLSPNPTINSTNFSRQSTLICAVGLDSQQQQRGRAKHRNKKSQEEEEEEELRRQQLSGAQVLRALQRASARKIKKNHKERVERSRGRSEESDDDGGGDVADLCIRSEWVERLDNLENQLRQLMHS